MFDDIKKKIKDFLFLSEDEQYAGYIQYFRDSHIPERYNQVKLLDELNNPDIDHFISISNRTDGKSYNYIHALLNISIDFNIGLSFFSRNMMLRTSYQDLLNEIIETSPLFERKDFNFIRTQYYVQMNYKEKPVAIIADLNNATELKYFSNFIKHFPIMVFDEFLSLSSDYLIDEWERLKTIYESIDRVDNVPLIGKPKIFYLGNAVNFDSPILHGLKIFNILENHPINTAKIYKYQYNIFLEMNRNDNANEERNTRAFASDDDAMTTGKFKTNPHQLADDNVRNSIKRNPRFIYVKLDYTEGYMVITFNPDTYEIILSIESDIDSDYNYNLLLSDNKKSSIFLDERYFDDNHIKRIDRGDYYFNNNFSKKVITGRQHQLSRLKINKLLIETMRKDNTDVEIESKEKQFTVNYIENTKRQIFKKMMM